MHYQFNCNEFYFFPETLCTNSFYNINSILTKRRSLPDRVEAFKNIFFPENLRIFPSPNLILKFPFLAKKVKTGHVYLAVLKDLCSLLKIKNQNIIESLIKMFTEIKQKVQSLLRVSVVNSTHHNAQSLFKGKCFCVGSTVVNIDHHKVESLFKVFLCECICCEQMLITMFISIILHRMED